MLKKKVFSCIYVDFLNALFFANFTLFQIFFYVLILIHRIRHFGNPHSHTLPINLSLILQHRTAVL